MDGGQRRKIEAKQQKKKKKKKNWGKVAAILVQSKSRRNCTTFIEGPIGLQEYDPNNALLIKENMSKRTDVKYWCS